jgi:hypothetical protein
VGGALGVAILGSLLSSAYAAHLGDAVEVLPPGAREEAGSSIVATLGAAEQVRAGGDDGSAAAAAALTDRAADAFVSAMHLTAIGTASAAVVAAVVVFTWLPGRHRPTDTSA